MRPVTSQYSRLTDRADWDEVNTDCRIPLQVSTTFLVCGVGTRGDPEDVRAALMFYNRQIVIFFAHTL